MVLWLRICLAVPGNEGVPDQGPKIPHAEEQLSPYATTRGTACRKYQVPASQLVSAPQQNIPHDAVQILSATTRTQHSQNKKQKNTTIYWVAMMSQGYVWIVHGVSHFNPAKLLNIRYFYLLFLDKETEFGKVKLLSHSYNLEMEIRIWTLCWVFRTCDYIIDFRNNVYLDERWFQVSKNS